MSKAFVICPQEEAARIDRAAAHFAERKLQVTLFNPLHAATAGLKTVLPYEIDNPGSGFVIEPKGVGIWLAHWTLWNAIQFLPQRYTFVLEIDAELPADWYLRIKEALDAAPPDFDMLYVGSCCTANKPTKQIGGNVFEVQWPFGSFAYIVARKALPVLISTMRRCWAHVDIQLSLEVFPKIKCYTVLPRIVTVCDMELPP